MKEFADLFNKIEETTKANVRIKAIVYYLQHVTDQDKLWFIALFTGKRPKRSVSTTLLKEWTIQNSKLPFWLFEQTYHTVGDLAETITLLNTFKAESTIGISLSALMEEINTLKDKDEFTKREVVEYYWSNLSRAEVFIFNKLITGGFRIGISKKTVIKALSKIVAKDENTIAHRLMGNWSPENTTFSSLLLDENVWDDKSKPYPFYLAYALENLNEIGEINKWIAEQKWDGIRGQLIIRNGELFVWSRGEELVTDKYPEFQEVKNFLKHDIVLDGEIIGFKDHHPLPFNHLQTRIGRKNISPKLLEKVPVKMICYDVLEYEGVDIRQRPLHERKRILENAIPSQQNTLLISEMIDFKDWDELKKIRNVSRENFSEGLMLKHKDSVYDVGRKKGNWWKWKIDPLTIDAVMIYAMKGHGRRANLYTDYTFAVWDEGNLVTFTKAYSGLTDEEIKEVDRFVKKNTLDRFGPVRSVSPELVFELAFEGIAKSSRHKSGIALRFPRISRWRKDKKPEEANTLSDLKDLLTVYGDGGE